LKEFFASPYGKAFIDIVEAAVLGAAIAAVALPDSVSAKEAVGLIAGGAIGSVKAAARAILVAFIASRQTPTQ
jgi:hypothetical protein